MKFCTALLCTCLLALSAWAGTVKSDPATGKTSDGLGTIEVSIPQIGLPVVQDVDALQRELDGLFAEAEFLKYAGRDDVAVWNRIREIQSILEPRVEDGILDEGGETCESAFVITSLPFCDTGNTADNVNNYEPTAAQDRSPEPPGGTGNDVVYVYTPTENDTISVSLCGSSFDTYLHIYAGCPGSDNSFLVCCNDDHAGTCPSGTNALRSCCPDVELIVGFTYYIVVDGWRATSAGNYQIHVTREERCGPCPPPPPCVECPAGAYVSVEPICFNGYVDVTNVGCVTGATPLLEDVTCNSIICGTAGSYLSASGAPRNDNDWYRLNITAAQDSVNIAFKAVAGGAWALYRIVGADPCGNDNDAVLVGNGNFPACQTVYANGCVEPGEYWLGIGLNNGTPCGAQYRIDIQCLDCPGGEPCVVCPEGSYVSPEPDCYAGYVDQFNGGCIAGAAPQLEDVSCNMTICGTAGRSNPSFDTGTDVDWYRLNVPAGQESLVVCIESEATSGISVYRVTGPNPCGEDRVWVGSAEFNPACQVTCIGWCVSPGEYWISVGMAHGVPCDTRYVLHITCIDCPEQLGRCCYVSEDQPLCANGVTRDWCAAVQGGWVEGATCAEACCVIDYCRWPIILPSDYEYTNLESTCCAADAPWCVGEFACNSNNCYPAAGAIIYKFTLASPGTIDLYASGPTDNQLMVFTSCDDPQGTCIASADNATDNVGNIYQGATEQILGLSLPAGNYYVATSTFAWTDNPCGEIRLTITSDIPLPAELTSFDAVAGNEQITLNWTTASETNLNRFELMRNGAMVAQIDANNSATGGNYTWTDVGLTNGTTYEYALISVDLDGASETLGTESAAPNFAAVTVSEYAMYQNYPNPFNPETSITFDIVENGPVRLAVYNSLGQTVAVVVDGVQSAGRHTVTFDGSALTSGLYFYRLDAGDFTTIRKMVLMK